MEKCIDNRTNCSAVDTFVQPWPACCFKRVLTLAGVETTLLLLKLGEDRRKDKKIFLKTMFDDIKIVTIRDNNVIIHVGEGHSSSESDSDC